MASPSEIRIQAERLARELTLFAEMFERGEESQKEVPPLPQEKPSTEPLKAHKQLYDNDPKSPAYDPEPYMKPEPPPPPRGTSYKEGAVLIKKGTTKVCRKCNTPAVIAKEDIVGEIDLKKLEIFDTSKTWAKPLQVDKKNGVCVTCPLCNELGLWLLGAPEVKNQNQGVSEGVITL